METLLVGSFSVLYIVIGLCIGHIWCNRMHLILDRSASNEDVCVGVLVYTFAILIWPIYLGCKLLYPKLEKLISKLDKKEE